MLTADGLLLSLRLSQALGQLLLQGVGFGEITSGGELARRISEPQEWLGFLSFVLVHTFQLGSGAVLGFSLLRRFSALSHRGQLLANPPEKLHSLYRPFFQLCKIDSPVIQPPASNQIFDQVKLAPSPNHPT